MSTAKEIESAIAEILARLNDLEVWRIEHEVGRVARQAQVDAALAELRRMRRSSPT